LATLPSPLLYFPLPHCLTLRHVLCGGCGIIRNTFAERTSARLRIEALFSQSTCVHTYVCGGSLSRMSRGMSLHTCALPRAIGRYGPYVLDLPSVRGKIQCISGYVTLLFYTGLPHMTSTKHLHHSRNINTNILQMR